jgi:hypothetical protein
LDVGGRFTGQSLWKAFRSLGVTGKTRQKVAADATSLFLDTEEDRRKLDKLFGS